MEIDSRTGYSKSDSVFYSKRPPIPLPPNPNLDVVTFISSQAHHGKIAFIESASNRRITYSEMWIAVHSVSSCLSDMGIRKGHVVLILSPNSLFFPIVCLSVMSIGAIITTANPLNTPSEIAKQMKDSKPVLAFTTRSLLAKLAHTNIPIVLIGSLHPNSACKIVASLDHMMTKEPGQLRARERVEQDDTATLLYSSGTTGASKGVLSTHRNLIAMVKTLTNRFSGEVFICTVPMFHIYGLAAFATGLLANGSTVVILSRFDMDEMMSAIGRYRATNLPLVPPILIAMVNSADRIKEKCDLSSLKTVFSGGAPLSKEVIDGFIQKYPDVGIMQGYGLTESTSIGASTDTIEESMRYGSAGMLSPCMQAKIVDPVSGVALGVNLNGELWLKGPTVMKGYLGNAEATASTLDSDGWLRTGDVCYIDDDGFIFVVDRLKELIKYKGYQVPPAELEALLLSHPDIADAAVIPFPDPEVGQFPMAFVVRKSGNGLSEKGVMEFVEKQVAPYKRIRRVAFIAAVPKNASGKILRKDLIQLATSKL